MGAKLREDPPCGLEFRTTDLWVCFCTLEGTQLRAVCLATPLFQPSLLICSSLGHQIINPQLLVLSTSSLSCTVRHSSFTSLCNVPATVLQGVLVYFIGEWDLEIRNQAVGVGIAAGVSLLVVLSMDLITYLCILTCVYICVYQLTCMCVLTHVHGCALAMYTLTSAHLSTHLHL